MNLWYYLDAQTGLVYLLAGRAYALTGPYEQKITRLAALAESDFALAPVWPIPDHLQAYQTLFDIEEGLLLPEMVDLFHSKVFGEVLADLRRQCQAALPKGHHGGVVFPEQPLILTTGIIANEDGTMTPLPDPGVRLYE